MDDPFGVRRGQAVRDLDRQRGGIRVVSARM
jgi:hypothetical protein